MATRWVPFDAARNFPDLGPKFKDGEVKARSRLRASALAAAAQATPGSPDGKPKQAALKANKKHKIDPAEERKIFDAEDEDVMQDARDLAWSAVLKRTFEAYIRGEQPNMYGEWLHW